MKSWPSVFSSAHGRQSVSSSSRCAASITSGGAGFCNQALTRSNPPATVPTANTATTIHTAEDMEQLSAYDQSFAAGYARLHWRRQQAREPIHTARCGPPRRCGSVEPSSRPSAGRTPPQRIAQPNSLRIACQRVSTHPMFGLTRAVPRLPLPNGKIALVDSGDQTVTLPLAATEYTITTYGGTTGDTGAR